MEVKAKTLLIGSLVLLAVGGALGRYATPEKVRVETKTITIEKKVEEEKKRTTTDTERDKHREVIVTEIIKPDGTREVTTRTVENTETKRKTDQKTDRETKETTQQQVEEKKEVTKGSSPVTISALVGMPLQFSGGLSSAPVVYGASISRPLLGPIAVSVWGLSNATFGFGLGVIF